MKFNVGDRVMAIGDDLWADVQVGELGTVIAIRGNEIFVKWDRFHEDGHDCGCLDVCPSGYGTIVCKGEIELADDTDEDTPYMSCHPEEVI